MFKQRQPSKSCLCLEFFSGHFKKIFLAVQKMFNTCKQFQKLKIECQEGQTYFFSSVFVFISWIGTILKKSTRRKKITRLTRLNHTPTSILNQLSLLQVMLAQAINQQDRNAAAQLRETLRCLSLFDQVNIGLGVTGIAFSPLVTLP